MQNIKLKSIKRHTLETLITYLAQSQELAAKQVYSVGLDIMNADMIITGCILYELRVSLNNKLARFFLQSEFTFSLDRKQAVALLYYHQELPPNRKGNDWITISEFMGKISKQLL